MKKIGILLVACAIVLSACGKRTDDTGVIQGATEFDAQGNPVDGTGAPAIGAALGQEMNVLVISSEPSILTGGQETADITVIVSDSDNLPVADMPIAFSTSGGQLRDIADVTDVNGEASAVLSLSRNAANQDIFVTAVADTFEGVARVVAHGSTIELTGDDNVVLGNDVTIEATLSRVN